jgi:addiction module HigA family antidote
MKLLSNREMKESMIASFGRAVYHPGDILRKNIELFHLDTATVAEAICVDVKELDDVVSGEHPLTCDLAIRLAQFFQTEVDTWLEYQINFNRSYYSNVVRGFLRGIKTAYQLGTIDEHATDTEGEEET